MKAAARRTMVAAMTAFVALAVFSIDARPQHGDDAVDALAVFRERIGAYATLHRDVASRLPSLVPFEDSRTYLAVQASLASAMKAARPTASQGDIFTPAVAVVLRQTIGDALCGRDTQGMFDDPDEEQPASDRSRLHVHDRYPVWATHEVPVILLQRLPRLPEGMFYRFVDRDLALWDADADLIVDVLPDAVSAAVATPGGCRRARLAPEAGGTRA